MKNGILAVLVIANVSKTMYHFFFLHKDVNATLD